MPALQTSVYTLLLFAAATSAYQAVHVASRRTRAPAASALALLMASAAFYAAGSALEVAAATLSGKLAALALQYVGVAPLPSFWLLFSWRSLNGRRPLPRAVVALMVVVPAVTVVLNWSNGLHHLYYAQATLDTSGPFPVVRLSGGPWYKVYIAFLETSILAGNLMLLVDLLRGPAAARRAAAIRVAASIAPWVGHALYQSGASPWGLDLSPVLIPVSGLFFGVGVLRFQMLDLVPAARERVFEAMDNGVIVVDESRRIADYNPAAAAVCRGLNERAPGVPVSEALAQVPALAAAIAEGAGAARIEVQGSTYDVRLQPVRSKRGGTMGLAVLLIDITGQVDLMHRLEKLATVDELTGLANRRQFFELGRREEARARREGRPISVALMDLDHFKRVNDTYGHAAGDATLRAVADACRTGVRLSDLVGRYGGEELAFVFPEADAATAVEVAHRLRAAIAASVVAHEGAQISVTASFGVASTKQASQADLETLLQAADRALYRAKGNGRNRVELATDAETLTVL